MLLSEQKKVQYGQYEVPESNECVSLNVGQPSNFNLPIIERNQALAKILESNDSSSMQYGKIEGYDEFKNDFANFLSETYTDGYNKFADLLGTEEILLHVEPNSIVMTNGNTGGLMLLLSLFSETNMTIFVEDPTYFLALDCFKDVRLNIVPIKMTPCGLDLNQLENELEKIGQQKCLLYTIPIMQNPTGYTLDEGGRIKLSIIANKYHNLLVFADEVYHMLNFGNQQFILPMCYYHKNFISMGSFSKIFAPSLRLGWIQCLNNDIITKIIKCGQLDSSGCMNPLSCQIAHELIKQNLLKKVIDKWINFLFNNCNLLYNAITNKLSEHIEQITKPKGGYFIWIQFKKYVNTVELSKIMDQYKIKFHHGNKFSISKNAGSCVRLSFSWYVNNDYNIFVDRMKNLIEENSNVSINSIDLTDPIDLTKRVFIQGHNGRLGKLILEKINNLDSNELTFGGTIERNSNLEFIDSNSVIIDVSSVEGTTYLLQTLLQNKQHCPIVIGTTGNLPMELINEYSTHSPVAISANFSDGMRQFKKFINVINKDDWKPFLSERHHIFKKDAPSGTAKLIANWYGNNLIPIESIESVRENNIIGEHHLILDNGSEYIKISHVAKSRELFANGAIKWLYFVLNQQSGVYYEI